MEPMALARLVQLADPRPGERVLVVGAGTGYGVAVLAACGAPGHRRWKNPRSCSAWRARPCCADLAPGVQLVSGPLAEGWRAAAPYDLVFIEGGFEELPAAIAEQLRPSGGRLVGVRVLAGPHRPGRAGRAGRSGAGDQPAAGVRLRHPGAARAAPKPGFVF